MAEMKTRLRRNLDSVRERIASACARAGRSPETVTLVAVTKAAGPAMVDALIELGVTDIGENRVQDALEKADALSRPHAATWHMIGHLQRNKVKQALRLFQRFHSVDSLRLAAEIERVAAAQGCTAPVMLEVNVSGEESKHGLHPDELSEVAGQAGRMEHLKLEGLMTMAPFGAPETELRAVFAGLRELSERLILEGLPRQQMKHLSMGMTQDFEIAVEEGATMVRVGTALFEGIDG